MNLIEKYIGEAVPKGGRQHTKGALKSFAKRTRKEAERYKKVHDDPKSAFNIHLKKIEKNKPEWTKLEGHDILKVKGSNFAALPATGKKNAANFVIFNVKTREEIAYLKKKEVNAWLTNKAIAEKE